MALGTHIARPFCLLPLAEAVGHAGEVAEGLRLLDEVLSAGPDKVGKTFYERSCKQRDQGGTPPEKGADLAVFLASAASDGLTGKLISAVWDDWANFSARKEQLAGSDVYTLRRIVPEDRGMSW